MARRPVRRAAAREAGGVAQAGRRRGGGYPRTMVPPQLDPLPAVQA